MKQITLGFVALLAISSLLPAQTPARKALVTGNTQFALDLYSKLRSREGNLFFSPFSISTALAMTYGGARGETAEEMARTLHFGPHAESVSPSFAALLKDLERDNPTKSGYRLSLANALWMQKDFGLLPDFINLTRDSFQAGLHEVDFQRASEAARRTINSWVENKTQHKIKDLLQPGVINASTRMVLANAIYFKGLWASQFKKQLTREEVFRSAHGPTKAPFMHQRGKFNYAEDEGFQVLEMPYKGKDLSMVIFLPRENAGLVEFEKRLSETQVRKWLGQMSSQEVRVALPRFKTVTEFNLNETLRALGMRQAFTPGGADFTGMSGSGQHLFIQAVVHKAFVEVNEEGTEAAAATGVGIALTALPQSKEFRADHPFLFLIRELRTGSILFMGRLTSPQA